jgi:sulfite reductase (NADPH) flavoprotein alpha-component
MLHLRGGLAGLMGLPGARANQFAGTNWLLFVERLPQHERVLEAELQAHPGSGRVRKLDLRSSLGTHSPAHLKDALRTHADRLRDCLECGAHLRVCGCWRGMGEWVRACLVELLEESAVDALLAAGRYRMEVFWERGFGIGDSGFAGRAASLASLQRCEPHSSRRAR